MKKRGLGRRSSRALAALLLLAFILVGLPILVVGFPDPLFPHRVEHGNLTLRSDAPLDPDIAETLSDVARRLAVLEIDDRRLRHRIFLSQSQGRYAFFARLMRTSPDSQGINAPMVHTIFLSAENIGTFHARYGHIYRYSLIEGDLAHVIAHEIAHTLIIRQLGFRASRQLPLWKREGYAEFAAVAAVLERDRNDTLKQRFARLGQLRLENIGSIREQYVLGQVLTEYLMTVEGWSFAELMADDTNANVVMGRLEEWIALERPQSLGNSTEK